MIHGYDDEGENRDAIESQHTGQEERPAENAREWKENWNKREMDEAN